MDKLENGFNVHIFFSEQITLSKYGFVLYFFSSLRHMLISLLFWHATFIACQPLSFSNHVLNHF